MSSSPWVRPGRRTTTARSVRGCRRELELLRVRTMPMSACSASASADSCWRWLTAAASRSRPIPSWAGSWSPRRRAGGCRRGRGSSGTTTAGRYRPAPPRWPATATHPRPSCSAATSPSSSIPRSTPDILGRWFAAGGDEADVDRLGVDGPALEELTRTHDAVEPGTSPPPRRRVLGWGRHRCGDHAESAMSELGEFRAAAGQFASGVTVVTTHAGVGMYGLTASSFASLSLNPLLVSVSVNRSSPLLAYAREAGAYAVSVLSSGQQRDCRLLRPAWTPTRAGRFRRRPHRRRRDRGAGGRWRPQLVRLRRGGRPSRRRPRDPRRPRRRCGWQVRRAAGLLGRWLSGVDARRRPSDRWPTQPTGCGRAPSARGRGGRDARCPTRRRAGPGRAGRAPRRGRGLGSAGRAGHESETVVDVPDASTGSRWPSTT